MTELKKGSLCLSFDNRTGVLRIIEISYDGTALCECTEDHPAGYKKGYQGWWQIKYLNHVGFSTEQIREAVKQAGFPQRVADAIERKLR